jgi:hypothetical protein
MKINLYIVNDVTYKHTNFYYKILYIVGYSKIKNLIKFVELKILGRVARLAARLPA